MQQHKRMFNEHKIIVTCEKCNTTSTIKLGETMCPFCNNIIEYGKHTKSIFPQKNLYKREKRSKDKF